jgi:hypothetical protein
MRLRAQAGWAMVEPMMLLVPADVLRPRRADEHFAPEANAAREAGLQVAIVDHDALATGDGSDGAERGVARVPEADAGGGLPGLDAASGAIRRL